MELYNVRYIPTSFWIDRTGLIRAIYTGPMTLAQLEEFCVEVR